MKKMKKFFAMFLALAMVLGMSVTTFAAPNNEGTGITVSGVEEETNTTIKVKAYQIVRYNPAGSYEAVKSGTIPVEDGKLVLQGLTGATAVAELAADTTGLPVVELEKAGDVYRSNTKESNVVTAGTWMIIVEGSQKYLYNPAIVSVQRDPDGLDYGTLNFSTDTWGNGVYLKKSAPSIDKTVENPNDNESVQYGDVLNFTVTADIPYYTDEIAENGFVYTIEDTLTGLSLVVDDDHKVSVTLQEASEADLQVLTTLVNAAIVDNATSFEVDLSTQLELLKKYPDKDIVITYSARVTSDAELIIDEVGNDATLRYSTNDGVQEKSKTTEHYTFGISAKLNGQADETLKQFVKINEAGDVKVEDGEVVITGEALSDAVFQVHEGSSTGAIFAGPGSSTTIEGVTGAAYTTKEDGTLEITGLDADKVYYLIEVKAPTGYTLNSEPVKISATKKTDANGFTGYTVTIGDQETGTSFTYNKETKTTTIDGVLNPFGFKNSSLTELPSTGGIGTTIFTVGGCAIMIIAAGLYFSLRRKAAK